MVVQSSTVASRALPELSAIITSSRQASPEPETSNTTSTPSPAAMIAFYASILKKIKKRDGNIFHGQIKLSKAEKVTLAAVVYTKQRFLRL